MVGTSSSKSCWLRITVLSSSEVASSYKSGLLWSRELNTVSYLNLDALKSLKVML